MSITPSCKDHIRHILETHGLPYFFENCGTILGSTECGLILTPKQIQFIKDQIPKASDYVDPTINLIVIILGYEPQEQ